MAQLMKRCNSLSYSDDFLLQLVDCNRLDSSPGCLGPHVRLNERDVLMPQVCRCDPGSVWRRGTLDNNWDNKQAAYCSNFWTLRFWATLWGLRVNVRCPSWAHWKARNGLPISVNWTFFARSYGWGTTEWKWVILLQCGNFHPKFPVEGVTRLIRPMNALNFVATVFTQRNFLADFLQAKCNFRQKLAVLRFWGT